MRNILLILGMAGILSNCHNDGYIRIHFVTKEKYRCKSEMGNKNYKNDSILFLRKFEKIVQNRREPYNAMANNKQTVVYIDTIIFSTNHLYAAILVMTKCTPTKYNPLYSYNGMVHYAEQVTDPETGKSEWEIFEVHGAHYINGDEYKPISDKLRVNNFIYRSYASHENNEIGFNIDDCRFWSSDEFVKTIKTGGTLKNWD